LKYRIWISNLKDLKHLTISFFSLIGAAAYMYTDKKGKSIFFIYKEIQSGAVACHTVYEEGLPNV
jgi:hypothetical protein